MSAVWSLTHRHETYLLKYTTKTSDKDGIHSGDGTKDYAVIANSFSKNFLEVEKLLITRLDAEMVHV